MLNSFNSELEKMDGFETDFVKVLYYDLPRNYVDTYHSHSYTRFCTILEGHKNITIQNREFSYDSSQSLLMPPHSKVLMHIEEPTKALVFELNDDLISSVAAKTCDNHLHLYDSVGQNIKSETSEVLISNLQKNICDDLQNLVRMSQSTSHKETFLIDLYAQKLIYDLLHTNNAQKVLLSQTASPMEKAISIMTNNIDLPMTISEIANTLGMTESNFSHAFKKYVGKTPHKYFRNMKLERALKILKTQNVTETAFDLGFENPSYFIRAFKSTYGVTPKQYQLNRFSSI